MAPVVRFAPSPTGLLHIGNARTALLNALFARREGGTFVLRFDDTDLERSKPEFAAAIEADLAWLGIPPDVVVRQSDRFALYADAAERLKAMGRLYAAYETPDELEFRRKRQLARGLPPVYDRAALRLTAEEKAALEAEGRRPHWRFRLDHRTVEWPDLVRGASHVDCGSLSDPVLVRADGSYLYTLPSVVDDIELDDHARDPRRGPRHQHRRADPDLRGARRRRAGLRAPQPPDDGERRGAVEAPRPPVAEGPARGRARAAGGGLARRARRLGRGGAAGARRSTSSRALSTSRISRAPRRSSTRPSSSI